MKLDKIKQFFKELAKTTAKKNFLAFLVLVFIALVIGGFSFYKYSILTEREEPVVTQKSIQFKKDLYQKVLEVWQEREKKFQETSIEEYFDPFR